MESKARIAGTELQFVTIGPGTFMMGSDSGHGDEKPVHKVTIDYSFDIAKTEVTVAQFKTFVEATGYETDAERQGGIFYCPCPDQLGYARGRNWQDTGFDQTEDHPVCCVSFNDAKEFCKWLSQQSGHHFRLPTEAEWEYACRAGTTGDYAGDIRQMACFDMTAQGRTNPVAQKKPNPWQLYDMHGNVWEWCEDIYYWQYYNAPTNGSANLTPEVPAAGASRRVLRGGAWCSPGTSCTSSFRRPAPCAFKETGTGFRVVCCKSPAGAKSSVTVSPVNKATKFPARNSSSPSTVALTVGDIEFDFVRIDPGAFVMGNDSDYIDRYGWTYELPKHEVTIGYSYYMGATEVTLEQFDLFVTDTGYVTDAEKYGFAFTCMPDGAAWHYEMLINWRFPGFVQTDSEPVTHITWYDALAFCRWLSGKTGRDIRLPSEAEWEYACRAGTTGEYAGKLDEMGWCLWNSYFKTYRVAQKRPNAWGLYDMHGNVWEWVLDMWNPDANGPPSDGSARLTSPRYDCGITRGGSFGNPPWLCRSYIRMKTTLGPRAHYNNGFRLLMSLDSLQKIAR